MHVTSLNLVKIAMMNGFLFHTIPALNVHFLPQTELCFKILSVYVMTWTTYQEGCRQVLLYRLQKNKNCCLQSLDYRRGERMQIWN